VAAGNVNVAGNTPETGGVVGDLDETFDLVENDGYDVNGTLYSDSPTTPTAPPGRVATG
jgi:hypothetical protein